MPRFFPCSLLVSPSQFGRAEKPHWIAFDAGTLSDADVLLVRSRRASALMQHQLAVANEAETRERGITEKEMSTEMGVSVGTLGKKLRGHDPLRGEDMFAWVIHLGRVDLWPAPANLDELTP